MPDWLPKIGIQMTLADSLRHFQWYGRGPQETYPDRKTGAKVGVYSGSVDDQYEPYLIPQDYGNKTDVRWAALVDDAGDGLLVVGKEHLNVSVHCFDTDNLTRALYPFQLVRQHGVTLNVDHRVSGVGGTPIKTLPKYRVLPGEFSYSIRLRPFCSRDVEAKELARQNVFGE
jgi:beta-galactosidase